MSGGVLPEGPRIIIQGLERKSYGSRDEINVARFELISDSPGRMCVIQTPSVISAGETFVDTKHAGD